MNITPHEDRAEKALSGLEMWANKLLVLANAIMSGAQYSDSDHLGFMSLCFLSRQIDHMQSLMSLIPNKDASLISRSMVEGLVQLLWSAQKSPERPLQWRAFAYIHDWRLLQEKSRRGESVPEGKLESNAQGIEEYGHIFYTKTARKSKETNQPFPADDPSHRTWRCGIHLKQIFDDVEADLLYSNIYSSFSDWHHWGVASLGETLSWGDDEISFSSKSFSTSAISLAAGFQCLFQTIELINEHLSLQKESQIAEIRDGYIEWHQKMR